MSEKAVSVRANALPPAHGEPTVSLTPAAQLGLVDELSRAIERREFEMFYQPRVDCRSEAIAGLEALVRWRHPRFGWLQPKQFIPLFEQSGAIRQLGDWIMESVCGAFPELDEHFGTDLPVAVNVSSRQLEDPAFAVKVLHCSERAGTTERLELELTETARLGNKQLAAEQLRRLAARGVTVALDDFGTGFSTLQNLRLFPVGVLKIDATFVKNIALDRNDAKLVESIIVLAHSLGSLAIAEGVESPVQAASLCSLGCDQAQGFYYFRPQRLGGARRCAQRRQSLTRCRM